MKQNKSILISIVLGFSCLKLFSLDLDLRYEYENFSIHKYRLRFKTGEQLFLVKDVLSVFPDFLPVIGFSAPWFTIGPVIKYGLLKEMDNSGGYTANSGTFAEKTAIKPDTAMEVEGKTALVVNPLPGILSLYGIMDKAVKCGSFCTFSLPDLLILEAALNFSLPAESTVQTLMHFAGKLVYANRALSLSLSAVLAAIPAAQPGYLTHFVFLYKNGPLRPGLFLGCYSAHYLNPEGKSAPVLFRAESILELLPCPGISIQALYGIRFRTPSATPGFYLPAGEYLTLETAYACKPGRDIEIKIRSLLGKAQEYTAGGEFDGKINFSCSTAISAGFTGWSVDLEAVKEQDKTPLCTIIPAFSCKLPGLKLDLGLRWQSSAPAAWGFSLKTAFTYKQYAFHVKLAIKEIEAALPAALADKMYLKLSWETNTKTPAPMFIAPWQKP